MPTPRSICMSIGHHIPVCTCPVHRSSSLCSCGCCRTFSLRRRCKMLAFLRVPLFPVPHLCSPCVLILSANPILQSGHELYSPRMIPCSCGLGQISHPPQTLPRTSWLIISPQSHTHMPSCALSTFSPFLPVRANDQTYPSLLLFAITSTLEYPAQARSAGGSFLAVVPCAGGGRVMSSLECCCWCVGREERDFADMWMVGGTRGKAVEREIRSEWPNTSWSGWKARTHLRSPSSFVHLPLPPAPRFPSSPVSDQHPRRYLPTREVVIFGQSVPAPVDVASV